MKRAPFFEIHIPELMNNLRLGKQVEDYAKFYEFCDYIDTREDCNDFRMISLQRLLIQYNDKLPEEIKNRIKSTVLNFRYWMTEKGNDNMCYWSENHQLLFASCEYIASKLYPEEVFTNTGQLGKDKVVYALERINHWFEMRFNTGFIEWHSHVYYAEDLAALMHLIDFSDEEAIVKKATIITDLLFLDMAMHSYKGNFALTHGRSYELQKKSPKNADIAPIVSDAFKINNIEYDYTKIPAIFAYRIKYELPKIIYDIARDERELVVKDQMGFDLKTIRKELNLKDELDRFVIWQMEGFSNPEVINNSIDMLNEYDLYSNKFLADFKSVSNPLLRKLGLLPLISRIIKPVTDGVAIQQVNTYTYKTKYFSMSTAQKHYPGSCGDQQHIMNVCFDKDFNVFITHPAVLPYDEENAYLSLSPNNWVGNGRMPHSVQDKQVNLTIYKIPKRKAFMEKVLNDYTHAYFPVRYFEKYLVDKNYAFLQYNKSLLAFITNNPLNLINDDELVQYGKLSVWVTELSNLDKESFEDFIKRIKGNKFEVVNQEIRYSSEENDYILKYKKDFIINGKVINTVYQRFDTPYIKAQRYDEDLQVNYQNKSMKWNLNKMIRKEEGHGKK